VQRCAYKRYGRFDALEVFVPKAFANVSLKHYARFTKSFPYMMALRLRSFEFVCAILAGTLAHGLLEHGDEGVGPLIPKFH
jgi:hypothetical protein